jgi:hypothetical protein
MQKTKKVQKKKRFSLKPTAFLVDIPSLDGGSLPNKLTSFLPFYKHKRLRRPYKDGKCLSEKYKT